MTDNKAELVLCKQCEWDYHVDLYFKERPTAPMMVFIRKDQYEIWKTLLSCSTEDMIVLKDYLDQDVMLKRYDIQCAYFRDVTKNG